MFYGVTNPKSNGTRRHYTYFFFIHKFWRNFFEDTTFKLCRHLFKRKIPSLMYKTCLNKSTLDKLVNGVSKLAVLYGNSNIELKRMFKLVLFSELPVCYVGWIKKNSWVRFSPLFLPIIKPTTKSNCCMIQPCTIRKCFTLEKKNSEKNQSNKLFIEYLLI